LKTRMLRVRVEEPLLDYLGKKRKELQFSSVSKTVRFLLKLAEYQDATMRIEMPKGAGEIISDDMREFWKKRGYWKI